jgi:menaquinone-dependent protoporphyrinogen oxidase
VKVAVGYETAHGSTKGIANEITERLKRAGIEAVVQPIEELGALDGYDAIVLGSAVHNQAWLPRAAAFVTAHRAELAALPVWLFSVSSVGDSSSFFGSRVAGLMRRARSEPRDITGFRTALRPRGHRNFAGAVERSHWDRAGHLFLKAFGGRYGDHRDWPDIDAWADGIARQLLTMERTITAEHRAT